MAIIKELFFSNENNKKNKIRVIDPCHGFSGRLIGSYCSGMVEEYTGIDLSEKTYLGALKTAEWIKSYENKLFKIYGTKINLVYGDCLVKMSKCKGCDLLMTFPPFLDVERYVGVKFEVEYDKWLTDFIDPFIKMGYGCLRVGGKMAVYLEKIDGRDFLKDFTEYAVKNGFQELNPVRFKMSYGENMRDKKETRSVPVLVFQK